MVSLNSIRAFLQEQQWYASGLLTNDVLAICDVLETPHDSRWFVAENKRCVALLHHWSERLRFAARQNETQLALSRDRLDTVARKSLSDAHRQIKQRSIDAYVLNDPQHAMLLNTVQSLEQLRGVVDGLIAALDTSLLVQEAVAIRFQEGVDSATP